MAVLTGLARVTISAPRRRVDVALPEQVAIAELLPELLGHAGEDLADDGEQHGGWVLRRAGGATLDNAESLLAQGVRDGDVLHLVPAWAQWPEPEYDDIADAIAAAARQAGGGWTAAATRVAAVAAGGIALAVGAFALAAGDPEWTYPLGVALVLTLAGMTASRAYGEALAGAALAAYAMPYAFLGGALVVADPAARLLTGSAAVLLSAAVGAVGTGQAVRVFVSGGTAAVFGVLGALLAFGLPADGAAAVVLVVLACGLGALPLLAIRFGRLPMPPAAPAASPPSGAGLAERPATAAVSVAVRRTGEILTGMLAGHALATAAASVVLVRAGGTAAHLLAGVAGVVLLLRARTFATVRQRVPVLAAGLAATAAPLVALAGGSPHTPAPALVTVVVAVALLAVAAGTAYATRAPSPYLGRAADLLDLALIVSLVPIACAVLDLYATVADLAGR